MVEFAPPTGTRDTYLHGLLANTAFGRTLLISEVKKEGRGGWGRAFEGEGSWGPGMNTKREWDCDSVIRQT
jgi:hypothetical protein